MKSKMLIRLLVAIIMVGGASACTRNSNGVQRDPKTGAANTTAALNGAEQGGMSGAKANPNRKVFLGIVGDSKIQMTLVREGDQLTGSYFYRKSNGELSLKGTIDKQGKFTLQEFDNNGKQTGEFKGEWKDDSDSWAITLNGDWKKPSGGEPLAFFLEEQLVEFNSGQSIVSKNIKEENKEKKFTIDALYPQIAGSNNPNAEKFNQLVKNLVTKETQEFRRNQMESDNSDMDMDPTVGSYLDVGYNVMLATDDLISISFGENTYERGAAHPNNNSLVVNFDLRSGTQLKLAELFKPGSNYLQVISDYSIKDLKRQAEKDMYDEEWVKNGAGPSVDNYQSWNITKKGLAITFDAYQVASYAEGPKLVMIPYSALKGIIKPGSVIEPLAAS